MPKTRPQSRSDGARQMRASLDVLPDGSAFLRQAGRKQKAIRVPRKQVPNFVLHGDTLDVEVANDGSLVKIIRVVHREPVEFEGRLELRRRGAFIVPDNPMAARRVFVAKKDLQGYKNGAQVLARIKPLDSQDQRPSAEIVMPLEAVSPLQTVLAAICQDSGIQQQQAPAVLQEAEKLTRREFDPKLPVNEDLRKLPLVTIDGFNAKDFDDAVWASAHADGYSVVVAVADVSGYVREGTAIDGDAIKRGTSVYFPHTVFPMLPERLSNDFCSLVPGQDRPIVAVRLEFDRQGLRRDAKLLRGFMHSQARLTYGQVNSFLQDGDQGAVAKHPENIRDMLKVLRDLAELRWQQRLQRGALEFDLPEPEFVMGQGGDVSQILYRSRGIGERMIEELMIAANEAVAEILDEAGLPVVFRIHPPPPPDKYDFFRKFTHNLGFALPAKPTPEALQRVVNASIGTPYERAVNVLVLRTMSQAEYSMENVGHFGLSLQHYCHFTSPIRRYPDLINHRWAVRYLTRGGIPRAKADEIKANLEGLVAELTGKEKAAEAAERAYARSLKARFLEKRVGETFAGVVSGVAKFGVFVELEQYLIEGLLSFRDLGDDYYVYDEQRFEVWGKRSGRRFRIGDLVQVQLLKVDVAKGFIDFRIIQHNPLLYGRLPSG